MNVVASKITKINQIHILVFHYLQIVLVPSNKDIYTDTAFALYRKYQLIVHNDNPERLQPKNLQRFCYNSPLKVNF